MRRITYLMMLVFTTVHFAACEDDSDTQGAHSEGQDKMI